jgi:hypothetical protein
MGSQALERRILIWRRDNDVSRRLSAISPHRRHRRERIVATVSPIGLRFDLGGNWRRGSAWFRDRTPAAGKTGFGDHVA